MPMVMGHVVARSMPSGKRTGFSAGHTDVVDADLSEYFDTIPHSDVLRLVVERIVDRHVLWLIKLWLKAPVEERDENGKRGMSGGKSNAPGTARAPS